MPVYLDPLCSESSRLRSAEAYAQKCDGCGGELPPPEIWEYHRDTPYDCDGRAGEDGRCRAYPGDEQWLMPVNALRAMAVYYRVS